jgi:hypothetical protein
MKALFKDGASEGREAGAKPLHLTAMGVWAAPLEESKHAGGAAIADAPGSCHAAIKPVGGCELAFQQRRWTLQVAG